MATVTVKCRQCSLEKSFNDQTIVPAEWKNAAGELVCPNCALPMTPIGDVDVATAEQAFAQAAAAMPDKVESLPRAETVETLTKRLHEIESARTRVLHAQATLDDRKEAAKEAKKHYDDEVETFLTVVGRMVAGEGALPLFTQEAEAAAQAPAGDANDAPALSEPGRDPARLWQALMDAGYLAATVEMIEGWDFIQRDKAWGWASLGGSLDAMPTFMRALMAEVETVPADDADDLMPPF